MSNKIAESRSQIPPTERVRLFHPLANEYGGPLLEGRDFVDLVDNIRRNGLLDEIDIWQGRIVDGRNRARACVEAGKKPRYHEWRFEDDAGAIAFIFAKNFHRRHLTPEQKAELVGKLFDTFPEKSVREIAAIAKVGLGTAARALRRVPDGTRPATRIDTKGRKQPTKKHKPKPSDGSEGGATPPPATSDEAEPRQRSELEREAIYLKIDTDAEEMAKRLTRNLSKLDDEVIERLDSEQVKDLVEQHQKVVAAAQNIINRLGGRPWLVVHQGAAAE